MPRCAGAPASSPEESVMMRQWKIVHSSDFEDLRQVPRWHDLQKIRGCAVWGAVIITGLMAIAVLLGREIAVAAWGVPGALIALAVGLTATERLREKESEGSS